MTADENAPSVTPQKCPTPSCGRDVEPVAHRRKCCLTCSDAPGLAGIHLAWCRRRNGDEPEATDA